uniref:Uncharacterized protein n=1 Tax=Triticum urartu TaxID=4572 RepID=A0A8R7R0H8_TRIUA
MSKNFPLNFLAFLFCLEILLQALLKINVWSVLVCPYLFFCFGLSFSFVSNQCCTALRYISLDAMSIYPY